MSCILCGMLLVVISDHYYNYGAPTLLKFSWYCLQKPDSGDTKEGGEAAAKHIHLEAAAKRIHLESEGTSNSNDNNPATHRQ